jgi:hypothetical protein
MERKMKYSANEIWVVCQPCQLYPKISEYYTNPDAASAVCAEYNEETNYTPRWCVMTLDDYIEECCDEARDLAADYSAMRRN